VRLDHLLSKESSPDLCIGDSQSITGYSAFSHPGGSRILPADSSETRMADPPRFRALRGSRTSLFRFEGAAQCRSFGDAGPSSWITTLIGRPLAKVATASTKSSTLAVLRAP
jgi:hypothetical protein